jgi:hypothetical protein
MESVAELKYELMNRLGREFLIEKAVAGMRKELDWMALQELKTLPIKVELGAFPTKTLSVN